MNPGQDWKQWRFFQHTVEWVQEGLQWCEATVAPWKLCMEVQADKGALDKAAEIADQCLQWLKLHYHKCIHRRGQPCSLNGLVWSLRAYALAVPCFAAQQAWRFPVPKADLQQLSKAIFREFEAAKQRASSTTSSSPALQDWAEWYFEFESHFLVKFFCLGFDHIEQSASASSGEDWMVEIAKRTDMAKERVRIAAGDSEEKEEKDMLEAETERRHETTYGWLVNSPERFAERAAALLAHVLFPTLWLDAVYSKCSEVPPEREALLRKEYSSFVDAFLFLELPPDFVRLLVEEMHQSSFVLGELDEYLSRSEDASPDGSSDYLDLIDVIEKFPPPRHGVKWLQTISAVCQNQRQLQQIAKDPAHELHGPLMRAIFWHNIGLHWPTEAGPADFQHYHVLRAKDIMERRALLETIQDPSHGGTRRPAFVTMLGKRYIRICHQDLQRPAFIECDTVWQEILEWTEAMRELFQFTLHAGGSVRRSLRTMMKSVGSPAAPPVPVFAPAAVADAGLEVDMEVSSVFSQERRAAAKRRRVAVREPQAQPSQVQGEGAKEKEEEKGQAEEEEEEEPNTIDGVIPIHEFAAMHMSGPDDVDELEDMDTDGI